MEIFLRQKHSDIVKMLSMPGRVSTDCQQPLVAMVLKVPIDPRHHLGECVTNSDGSFLRQAGYFSWLTIDPLLIRSHCAVRSQRTSLAYEWMALSSKKVFWQLDNLFTTPSYVCGSFRSDSRGCLLQDSCCYSSFQATKVQQVKVNNTYYDHGRPLWCTPFSKRSTF